ncbi:restriction endonuclease, partial [Thermus sp. 2.9]
ISPEGPDGGVDILAGSGELGFDRPRIAVQVKSTDSPVDIKTVRELQGAMKNYQADHGLFVSWGGFKQSVDKEKARLFFEIRLWDSDDLLREILRFYEKLPEDLQAELPLKRIWVLVSPPEGEP